MAIDRLNPLPQGFTVETEDTPPIPDNVVSFPTEDGGAIVDFTGAEDDDGGPKKEVDFGENLAESIDEIDLDMLASELISDYKSDRQSRKDWAKAYVQGLDLLGFKAEERTTPWPGASGVYHPLLTEAVVRFQAQTIMEVYPASGPVRTRVVGKLTNEKVKQAERVEQEMNYIITQRMTEYRPELEQLLFMLPIAGSAFKKTYFDPIKNRPVSIFVPAEDFVAPYGASDLETCPRYTHTMKKYENELKKLMYSGFYRDIDLPEPGSPTRTDIEEKYNEIDGDQPSWEQDDRYTILEMHVELDLKGFEDPSGIPLPYVVTIEESSAKVLSIRRNYDEDDPQKQKRMHFTHYRYLPGMGFYGLGLIHLIGGIAKSTTSILRQLIDAGTLSNLPAGLKARGLRIKGDSSPLMPGEFRDVDVASGAIRDSITFLPYKEPSAVLHQLLKDLIEEGRRIGSVADASVGEMNPNAPVGTTLAIIERTLKVMSAVQARVHAAMGQEFKLISDIIRDYMGPEYEYEVEGNHNRVEDFDDRVDVIPVSDPNATTTAQRVLQYQSALQMAQGAPELYNLPLLHRETLQVLGVKNADEIVKLPEDMKPKDPVTENMDLLMQNPVKAFEDQDHEAHLQVHISFSQDPRIRAQVGQSQSAPAMLAAMEAHIAEHMAFLYRRKIEEQLGVPLPGMDEQLPPDIEANVARMSAAAAQKLLQQGQQEEQQKQAQEQMQDPLVQMQMQELQIKAKEADAKIQAEMADLQLKRERLMLDKQKFEADTALGAAKIVSQEKQGDANLRAKETAQLVDFVTKMAQPTNQKPKE